MGLFDRIKAGLQKTRAVFSGHMDELVENYKKLDDEFFEDLSDILIMADVGMKTTELAVSRLREKCKAVSYTHLDVYKRQVEDLGADSANMMMLIMDLEAEYDMTVEDDMLSQIKTVDDIVKYIEKRVG